MTIGLDNFCHPVALSEKVSDRQARFLFLSQSLVLYRDDQGVVALSGLCIHRGAALSLG